MQAEVRPPAKLGRTRRLTRWPGERTSERAIENLPRAKKGTEPARQFGAEWMNLDAYSIERRSDGAVIVRVASRQRGRDTLPDAVFTFRLGDPQYQYWEQMLEKQSRPPVGRA